MLGVSVKTFRCWTVRYGEDDIEGLRDRRVSRASHRAAQANSGTMAEVYRPAFNAEFRRAPAEDQSAFLAMAKIGQLDNTLCEIHDRTIFATTVFGFRGGGCNCRRVATARTTSRSG